MSGDVILPFFRSAIGAEDKSRGGVFDPVTEADRGAEAAMRRLIAQTFPAHGVIGEEYGAERPDAEYVWVLDPIDGTKSFISGLPTWGTLIGLMHRGRPVYGMMAQPFTRERYFGDGKRARLRTLGVVARRRAAARLGDARAAHPRLRQPRRSDGDDDQPGADPRRGGPRGPIAASRRRRGSCATAAIATPIARSPPASSTWSSRPTSSPTTSSRWCRSSKAPAASITTWDGEPAAKGGRIIAAGDRRVYDEALRAAWLRLLGLSLHSTASSGRSMNGSARAPARRARAGAGATRLTIAPVSSPAAAAISAPTRISRGFAAAKGRA